MTDEDKQEGPREEQEPAAGQDVLDEVEPPPTGWGRVVAWFERPATLLDFGAIVILVIAALAGYALVSPSVVPAQRAAGAPRPIGVALSLQHVAWLLGLPEEQVVPAGLEIAGRPDAVFAPGEPLHLRISLRAPARVALLEGSVGGSGAQAWPGLGQAPALIQSPSSGGPAIQSVSLEAPSVLGTHRLRLVVAPADLDLGALSPAALPGVAGRLTRIDLRYEVTRPSR
jgi:hypothetical protein